MAYDGTFDRRPPLHIDRLCASDAEQAKPPNLSENPHNSLRSAKKLEKSQKTASRFPVSLDYIVGKI